jgi:hypothetical protein
MSKHQHERYRVGLAIVRVDRTPVGTDAKVVKVVFDPELAESERERLTPGCQPDVRHAL